MIQNKLTVPFKLEKIKMEIPLQTVDCRANLEINAYKSVWCGLGHRGHRVQRSEFKGECSVLITGIMGLGVIIPRLILI